jgi:hypothetical protein
VQSRKGSSSHPRISHKSLIFTAATAGTNSTRRRNRPAAQPATGRGQDGILDRHDVSLTNAGRK